MTELTGGRGPFKAPWVEEISGTVIVHSTDAY